MNRDRRLLIAMGPFIASAAACGVQAIVVNAFINSAVMGTWTHFGKAFSVDVPGSEPNTVCFDYCAPPLPFAAGWISIAAFLAGLAMVAHAWLKPAAP